MVAALEHRGVQRPSAAEHFLLAGLLRVAGEEEAVRPVGKAQHNGVIVQIAIRLRIRREHLQRGPAAVPDLLPRLRGRHSEPFFPDGVEQRLICLRCGGAAVRRHRHHNLLHRERLQHGRHAADVVGMRMGCHHEIERLGAEAAQLPHQLLLCGGGAGIYEDMFARGQADELAVRLADVEIIDLQRPLRRRLRGSGCSGAGRQQRVPVYPQIAQDPGRRHDEQGQHAHPRRTAACAFGISFSLRHRFSFPGSRSGKKEAPFRLPAKRMHRPLALGRSGYF